MAPTLTHVKKWLVRVSQLLAAVVVMAVTGCVQQTPVAYYAHPGGTIILGLGGIQRNVTGTTELQASDLAITLTADGTHFTALTPNKIFKAFPDYNSALTGVALGSNNQANMVPFDGGWFVSVVLPNNLAPNSYTISITSPTNKLTNTNNSSVEGDLRAIPLQVEAIPSGLSSLYSALNTAYNKQFSYYSTAVGRLDVSPNPAPAPGSPVIGGMELVITFPAANYTGPTPIVALPYNHNPSIQLAQSISDSGDGVHKSLVVLLSSSPGFATGANRTVLMPQLSDLSLSFLFYPASGINSNDAQQLADFKIDQSRSHYYDTSGNVITALTPTMTYQ